jgi:hypothetical protein
VKEEPVSDEALDVSSSCVEDTVKTLHAPTAEVNQDTSAHEVSPVTDVACSGVDLGGSELSPGVAPPDLVPFFIPPQLSDFFCSLMEEEVTEETESTTTTAVGEEMVDAAYVFKHDAKGKKRRRTASKKNAKASRVVKRRKGSASVSTANVGQVEQPPPKDQETSRSSGQEASTSEV